jgi:Tol biopolymer transport system component
MRRGTRLAVFVAALLWLPLPDSALLGDFLRLTAGNTGWVDPMCDPSGKMLIYRGGEDLYLYDVRDGVANPIVNGGVEEAFIASKRTVAFVSSGDHVGTNADGNDEIFTYDIKLATIVQVTDTVGAENGGVSINKRGRRIAFLSTADFAGTNADGNAEVFLYDTVSATFLQVTNTAVAVENDHPRLDGVGKYLYFDSNGDLTGGNADGNREIFRYVVPQAILEQVTNTTDGDCEHPVPSFKGRFVAFTSDTGDLDGPNADGEDEVYRLDTVKDVMVRVTNSDVASHSPLITVNGRFVAFESTDDITGFNADGSQEIFVAAIFSDVLFGYLQLTSGGAGTECASVTGSKTGRYVYVQSDADLSGDGAGFDHIYVFVD